MRINYGKYKSKLVSAIPGNNTRPTSDKVRESMFDVLNNHGKVKGDVLDLFAGSGALGIEAISRGCDSAVFIDKNPLAARILRNNVSFVKEHTEVYNTDWQVAVRKLTGKAFDIIFIDPPYALGIESKIMCEIESRKLLKDDGVIVIEHDKRNILNINKSLYEVVEKLYSNTIVTYLFKRKNSICVFPGSFDPITNGHIEVINMALNDFDKVIVAVAEENYKESLELEKRVTLVTKALEYNDNVEVDFFSGNLTDYLSRINCFNVVRGYRNDEDLSYERELKKIYIDMCDKVNFILYKAISDVSSTKVRNAEKNELDKLVPGNILDLVISYYNK